MSAVEAKFRRSKLYLLAGVILFVAYFLTTSTLTVVQLANVQASIEKQRTEDKKEADERLAQAIESIKNQHKKTQAYVKCVAQAMLVKDTSLREKYFNYCGIDVNVPQQTPTYIPRTEPIAPAPRAEEKTETQEPAKNKKFLETITDKLSNILGGK